MARGTIVGAVMNCQRCGGECPKTGYAQRYCGPCSKAAYREAAREWKRRHRAEGRVERLLNPDYLRCELCGMPVQRNSAAQKFCKPCRQRNDAEKWRAATRAARIRGGAAYKARAAQRLRERRARNPTYAISSRMSAALYQALKSSKAGKSWEALVGYTASELRDHIERQFVKGMGWQNMGEWHLDHIQPISSFSFSSSSDPDFIVCWGLANLRPIWAKENISKSARRVLLL